MQPDTLPTVAGIERALAEVYARPEFTRTETVTLWGRINEFFARIWNAVWEFIGAGRLLDAGGPTLTRILMVVLVMAAVAILAYLIFTAARGVRAGERGSRGVHTGGVAARARTAADWEDAARRAAAEGRYRDAALALYQALLLRLDARGALRYDPAKTPGDYRREARGQPEAARTLGAFLRRFEPVAFGGRPLDGEGYARLHDAAQGGTGA